MKKLCCLIVVLFICTLSVQSQDEDYAVAIRGDTIHGKISIIDNPLTGHSLMVKVGKKKVTYPSYKMSLLYKKGEVYHVSKIEGKYQFIKLVHGGYLSLYRYSPNDQQSAQMFQGSILVRQDGEKKVVPNLGFKKQLSVFLDDCESLSGKIIAGEYSKKDIIKIIDEYNACIPQGYSPKPGDIVEEIVFIPDTSKIDELINKVKSDSDLASNSEMLEMLGDVKKKLQDGEEIPGYLTKILKGNLEGKTDLLKLLDGALEN